MPAPTLPFSARLAALLVALHGGGCCETAPPIPTRPPADLAFHVAVRPGDAGVDIESARRRLEAGAAEVTPGLRWLPIRSPHHWGEGLRQADAIDRDAAFFFEQRNLVAEVAGEGIHLLVRTDPDGCVRRTDEPTWSVIDARLEQDSSGRLAVGLEIDDVGGARIMALTSAHVGESIACVLDGEVICAPTLMSAVSVRMMFAGDFEPEEADAMVRELLGSPHVIDE